MTEKTVAIIGAGVMGSDLALDVSSRRYRVILKDLDDDRLQNARSIMKKNYKFFKMMKPDAFASSLDELMSRISFTTGFDGLDGAFVVLENITESYDAKKELYARLRDHCRADALFGVNTSCIPITRIGALMPAPENVIGMHFMNPSPLKQLVEVVRGYRTSDETIERTRDFLKSLHKTCVVVNDSPGFVTNRVLMPMINECVWLVQDNVAQPRDVDQIFKLGFGHKMGPLATADLIGLDTILDSLMVLYDSYNDPKYRPCPLLKKMVDAGVLGKKTGRGFFAYDG